MKWYKKWLSLAVVTFSMSSPVFAKTDFNVVGKYVVGILQDVHYSQVPFDEKLSQTIFEDYLEELDPQRVFFTKRDYLFLKKKYGDKLHLYLVRENCMVAVSEIYGLYMKRVRDRVQYAKQLLKHVEFDFTKDEHVLITREDAEWVANEREARSLWKKRIKSMLLEENLKQRSLKKKATEKGKELDKKDLEDPRVKVERRYVRLLNVVQKKDEEARASQFFDVVAHTHALHTSYMSKAEIELFTSDTGLNFVGIGATLQSEEDGKTKIVGIIVNGPADRQGGLALEDRIVGVDSNNNGKMVDILYMPIQEVVELIRGRPNSEVRLKVEAQGSGLAGEYKEIVIKREKIKRKDAAASAVIIEKALEGSKSRKLGYLVLPSFYGGNSKDSSSSSKDVSALLKRMSSEGVEGLVMDLRSNGGGYLDEAIKITGLFTGRGPVVQVKNNYGSVDIKKATISKPLFRKPLVVLIDKVSASASEIFAGAIQDYNRGVVVGDSSTYGKGTVQVVEMLERFFPVFEDARRAGALKPTIQKFYRVSGSSTQLIGVIPDIRLPSLYDVHQIGESWGKHALKHDVIAGAKYKKLPESSLFINRLREESKKRVNASQDFTYIKEDIKREKSRKKNNILSLNEKSRLAEIEKSEERRKKRNVERRKRFAEMVSKAEKTTRRYRLTLDDIAKKELPLVDREKDKESYVKMAKDKYKDLNDNPEWPEGIDPTEREALHILSSLINYNEPNLALKEAEVPRMR